MMMAGMYCDCMCSMYRSVQYASPYQPDGSLLSQSVTQSAMMGLPNQYPGYDTTSLQHMGIHGDHGMQHTTRAHPLTVSFISEVKSFSWNLDVFPWNLDNRLLSI